jgi:SnoaL-like domain
MNRRRLRLGAPSARHHGLEINAAVALMDPDFEWPNVLQGTTLHGRDAVRAYCLAQFETIDPRVEPEAFEPLGEDEIVAAVHQVVRDRGGTVLADARSRTAMCSAAATWSPG